MLNALHSWQQHQRHLLAIDETDSPWLDSRSDAAAWLAEAWQVTSRETLIDAMLWLAAQGERYHWDTCAAELGALNVARRQRRVEELAVQGAPFIGMIQRWVATDAPLEWAAWDWLRLAELAWSGACCGYLEAAESDDFAAHAAELLQHRYAGWADVLKAYRRGMSLAGGMDYRDEGAAGSAQAPGDAWQPSHAWQAQLMALSEPTCRNASRARLRAYRNTPRHWLQAIAGVRDPQLMQRQRDPQAPLPEAKRLEAERYLENELDVHAEEGAEALTRYWLPAEAHHLNQMAADAAHGFQAPSQTTMGSPAREALVQRGWLRQASRHAATIQMAEKFAFYVQAAVDSRRFDDAALVSLAEALKSCLCHFYATPTRLLDAWLAWARCLSEPDDASLTGDIAWHRNDPGSVFHWLDWQPGRWREPDGRPSLRDFTAMALVGPLNSPAWRQPRPEGARERETIRQWLESHYQLHDARELSGFIDDMLEAGDRQDYQINYAPYTLNRRRLDEEIAILQTGDSPVEERNHRLRLERVRDNEDGCNDIDMAAWDIAQAVDLAIAGRELDWLSRSRLAQVLERAHALAATHYAGWQAYAEGLYAGFSFGMGETDERQQFLAGLRQALVAWRCGAPVLAGSWASLDFPGSRPRHCVPLHVDTLPGDRLTLH